MSDHDKDIHRTAVVGADGSVRVDRLPFHVGQTVDVTIHPVSTAGNQPSPWRYPLAGLPLECSKPLKGVADEDWEATR